VEISGEDHVLSDADYAVLKKLGEFARRHTDKIENQVAS
jgi:hypothetical protein